MNSARFTQARQNFVIIDGNALLHRAYHAYPQTLRAPQGELINAVYGFARMTLSIVSALRADLLAVAFDTSAPTFRHLEYAGYKAHRPKMEDGLADQLPILDHLVKAMGVKSYAIDGFEADDLIGTLVADTDKQRLFVDTFIVTGDQDAYQLIDRNTFVAVPAKGRFPFKIWRRKDFVDQFGFVPSLLVDYKALRGDPSDNIPGVRGIGDKMAKALVQQFGEIENLYRHLDEVASLRLRELLLEGFDSATFSKSLATIRKDAPLSFSQEDCLLAPFSDNKELHAFFERYRFTSLLKMLGGSAPSRSPEGELSPSGQLSLL